MHAAKRGALRTTSSSLPGALWRIKQIAALLPRYGYAARWRLAAVKICCGTRRSGLSPTVVSWSQSHLIRERPLSSVNRRQASALCSCNGVRSCITRFRQLDHRAGIPPCVPVWQCATMILDLQLSSAHLSSHIVPKSFEVHLSLPKSILPAGARAGHEG